MVFRSAPPSASALFLFLWSFATVCTFVVCTVTTNAVSMHGGKCILRTETPVRTTVVYTHNGVQYTATPEFNEIRGYSCEQGTTAKCESSFHFSLDNIIYYPNGPTEDLKLHRVKLCQPYITNNVTRNYIVYHDNSPLTLTMTWSNITSCKCKGAWAEY